MPAIVNWSSLGAGLGCLLFSCGGDDGGDEHVAEVFGGFVLEEVFVEIEGDVFEVGELVDTTFTAHVLDLADDVGDGLIEAHSWGSD